MAEITLTNSDIIGAVQRGIRELDAYLSNPTGNVDVALCVGHMERLTELMGRVQNMQPAAQNGANAEARAN